MQIRYVLTLIATLIFPHSARADAPIAVSLDPLAHTEASLTVIAPDGTATIYSPQELETLTTYRIETVTPWRPTAARFDGVMLRDILSVNGLANAGAIKVTAENDYAISIPREVWTSIPVLIATRADDQPISRRNRGPIQFVISQHDFRTSEIPKERYLVWMAARIEAE
jgi:hypothetical protein